MDYIRIYNGYRIESNVYVMILRSASGNGQIGVCICVQDRKVAFQHVGKPGKSSFPGLCTTGARTCTYSARTFTSHGARPCTKCTIVHQPGCTNVHPRCTNVHHPGCTNVHQLCTIVHYPKVHDRAQCRDVDKGGLFGAFCPKNLTQFR